jgi:hypothetical protein
MQKEKLVTSGDGDAECRSNCRTFLAFSRQMETNPWKGLELCQIMKACASSSIACREHASLNVVESIFTCKHRVIACSRKTLKFGVQQMSKLCAGKRKNRSIVEDEGSSHKIWYLPVLVQEVRVPTR